MRKRGIGRKPALAVILFLTAVFFLVRHNLGSRALAAKGGCPSIVGSWNVSVNITSGPDAGWSGSGTMDLTGSNSSLGGNVSISFTNGVSATGSVTSGSFNCNSGNLNLTIPLTINENNQYQYNQTYYVKGNVIFGSTTTISNSSTWSDGNGQNADSGTFSGYY